MSNVALASDESDDEEEENGDGDQENSSTEDEEEQQGEQQSAGQAPSNLVTYEDPSRGYRIGYPAGAQIEEVAAGTHFSNPQEGWSLGVLVTDHDGRELNQVVQEIADFERGMGFNIIDSSSILKVAGTQAQMITKEEEQEEQRNVFMIKDDKLYEFQLVAPLETSSSYVNMFLNILRSFEFIPSGQGTSNQDTLVNATGIPQYNQTVTTAAAPVNDTGSFGQGNDTGMIVQDQNHATTTTTQDSFLSYENPAYGVKMNYPSDWAVIPGNTTSGITNVATFFSPENDDYVSLSLYVEDLSVTRLTQDLGEYLASWAESYSTSGDFPGLALNSTCSTSDSDCLLSETPATLSGSPAYLLVGIYNDPTLGTQNLIDTATIRDNLAYSIQTIVSPSKYNEYQPTIDSMINSLEISR